MTTRHYGSTCTRSSDWDTSGGRAKVLEMVQLWGQALVTPDMPNLPEEETMTPRKSVPPPSGCICGDPNCTIPYGLCHCGCGNKTVIAKKSSTRDGQIKGAPTKVIHGHNGVKHRIDSREMSQFKIDGDYCRLIPLTRGLYTIVDAIEYEGLMQNHWCAKWNSHVRGYYAARTGTVKGKRVEIQMHRQILGLEYGDPRDGDYKEVLNTLDNRRANLRIVTASQGSMNRRKFRNNTSGFKGVTRDGNIYRARVVIDGVRIHLGTRKTAEAAYVELYLPAAIKHYGEFARFK
jgi:hypothetical protein